jgi:Fic family protein
MDLEMFGKRASGTLVPIHGTDPRRGPWEHRAFVPHSLPDESPDLSPRTYLAVANARAALGALDSTARQLPNPQLLRRPVLRREAQSTSALEGTYAPLSEVLTAADDQPDNTNLREIINYVVAAEHAFAGQAEGRPLSLGVLCELQQILVTGTASSTPQAGQVRDIQVAIGHRTGASVVDARFVPHPPGDELVARLRELVDWMRVDRSRSIDPVVAAAMAHYHFETLHPFNDGNGRIGRLLIVLQLYAAHVLSEPTLTVSPWFEARREEYYDALLGVSTDSRWDDWVGLFATGIEASAASTRDQMLSLVQVQTSLRERVRASSLRAGSAHAAVDFAVGHPSFTVRDLQDALGLTYGRTNKLVEQLIEIDVLEPLAPFDTYNRRFHAPAVLEVLLRN